MTEADEKLRQAVDGCREILTRSEALMAALRDTFLAFAARGLPLPPEASEDAARKFETVRQEIHTRLQRITTLTAALVGPRSGQVH